MKLSIVLLSFYSVLFSQHLGDHAVRKGADAFYNYEYERSIEILNKARKDYPDHPGVHVAWAAAHWRNDEANLSLEEIYANFDVNLIEIESIYDSLLTIHPDHPEYMLYYGSTRGLKARIFLGQKKWIPTLISAYQGFRIIQKAKAIDSTMTDTYLPIGIVEYYAGLSNVLVKAGAELFGLEASREEGIRKMEIAATQSPWAWTEAMSVLSYIYQFMEIDEKRGLEISQTLAKKYPKNFDYQLHYTLSLLQINDLKQAKKELDKLDQNLVKQRPRHQKIFSSYLNYMRGYYFFLIGHDEKAIDFLNQCVNYYYAELDAILGYAYLLRGKIMDKQGKRMEAVINYKKCIKLDNYTHAIILAEQYLDNPFQG